MTLATFISPADFDVLVDTAFQAETPQVLSSESAPGATLEHFADAAALKARAAQCIADGVHHFAFGLWYPSMKGAYAERRVVLEPPRAGHDFLHSLAGWGLIHLHLYVTPPATLQCRVAVNSEA
ncbi:MAG: hypothetical protein ACREVL_18765, partial [Solimonas sp.]